MNRVLAASSLGFLAIVSGCSQTPPAPAKSKPVMNAMDETFALNISPAKVTQGKTEAVVIGIKRGKDFGQDVSLKFDDIPAGITLDPLVPVISHEKNETSITAKAAEDAVPGDYTVGITGHPVKGEDSKGQLKLSIVKMEPNTTAEAAEAKWEQYKADLQKEWDRLSVKMNELSDRAAKAEGQAKIELDAKVAAAKVKMDAAGERLEEMKSASADRWEKIKEATANAFEELKKAFD